VQNTAIHRDATNAIHTCIYLIKIQSGYLGK